MNSQLCHNDDHVLEHDLDPVTLWWSLWGTSTGSQGLLSSANDILMIEGTCPS